MRVDPEYLISANIKPGMMLDFGDVSIAIHSVTNAYALAGVVLKGPLKGSGSVYIDLTEKVISIYDATLTAHVPILGNETIQLQKA